MRKVIYEFEDGSKTASYNEAIKKKEEGNLKFEVKLEWEDLPADKVEDGTPVSILLKRGAHK